MLRAVAGKRLRRGVDWPPNNWELGLAGMDSDLSFSQFWCNRPVAMTGATGFVGGHLARLLRSQSAVVRAVEKLINDQSLSQWKTYLRWQVVHYSAP